MNLFQMMQTIQQLQNNPQMILQRFGLPQDLGSPDAVVKYLMDNGKVTQEQINQVNSMYKQLFRR